MKTNRKYIWISLVTIITLLLGFLIPNTVWFKNMMQTRFIHTVIEQTSQLESYHVSLDLSYDMLGYEMVLKAWGQSQTDEVTHLHYQIDLNGKSLSPMTVDLDQYVTLQDNESMMYMSLNEGQWFKETAQVDSKLHTQFLNFQDLSALNLKDYVILEEDEKQRCISIKTDIINSSPFFQMLIENLFKISNDIDLTPIFKEAPEVEYILTINNETKLVTNYELNYGEGFAYLIGELQKKYPAKFPQHVVDSLGDMYMTLKISLEKSTMESPIEIPNQITSEAIEISMIK